jgi:S1-C subfamily serine protease
VLIEVFGESSVHAQTAQEIAKKAFGSTVLLVIEDANGQPLSLGSGFFIRDGEIASNLHVVEGAARGYAKLIGEKTKYDIEGITAVDPERDLVILKISARRSQALPIGNSDAVQVGESVYAVGNPQGLEGTFSQGIVSSIREVGSDKLLQITAPISPGSSGGPVLSEKGEVIGVSVATFRGGQNLNFAIPSNYLKTLIATGGSASHWRKRNRPRLNVRSCQILEAEVRRGS